QSGTAAAGPRDPWFRLDADTIQGQLDVTMTHRLRLGTEGPTDWRLTTELAVTPLRAEVDKLDLTWPAYWLLDRERGPRATKGAKVEFKEELKGGGMRFGIDTESLKEFTLFLEAQRSEAHSGGGALPPVPGYGPRSATIELPSPRLGKNRGAHKVIVTVPD